MELVLDTTPLIYLIKSGFYKYFTGLGLKLWTTGEVVKELRLEDGGYPENHIIAKLIEDKILVISNPKKIPKTPNGVHKGEASVITLAKEKGAVAVIDDRVGKLYGEGLGVKSVHSTFPVFTALKKGLISKEKAKRLHRLHDRRRVALRCRDLQKHPSSHRRPGQPGQKEMRSHGTSFTTLDYQEKIPIFSPSSRDLTLVPTNSILPSFFQTHGFRLLPKLLDMHHTRQ